LGDSGVWWVLFRLVLVYSSITHRLGALLNRLPLTVDYDVLWDTCTNDLPPLVAKLEKVLQDEVGESIVAGLSEIPRLVTGEAFCC
jgi:hypothetical protein